MLYSYFNDEDSTDIPRRKEPSKLIERIYDLYIYLLSFPVVREAALNKQDERRRSSDLQRGFISKSKL